MIITDAVVEKATDAANDCRIDGYCSSFMMRAAIEAIAPMLIAQGLREAVAHSFPDRDSLEDYAITEIREFILARAQKLDPQ